MSTSAPAGIGRDALKQASANAAAALVRDGMVVGLGTGSTAAFALEALARRHRQGLLFCRDSDLGTNGGPGNGTRHSTNLFHAAPAHRSDDRRRRRDGAGHAQPDQGARRRPAPREDCGHLLAIIVDEAKLGDRLGTRAPVPVEVVAFGLEATQTRIEALGAEARMRVTAAGEPFVTDSGNRILDCTFGPIADPARLEERIRRVVGVVESGLFIGWAGPVFVADAAGVHRLESPRAHRGAPPILVVMGVGKSTVAKELAATWLAFRGGRLAPS